jgi:hypothetical protein
MKDFQRSPLWQETLKPRADDTFLSERNRLRSAYDIFWDRGIQLAQRISTDLPGLTLHDEAHLSALWDRAGQLIGSDYPINPLEAFIFGGAILLHDAGHAFAAYLGGTAELKQTLEYRDAVVAILRRNGAIRPTEADLTNPPNEVADEALFMALRRLHAKQAEVLATRDFEGLYLIDDQELRQNLGQLIGRVAASHHWDRNSLEDKLPDVQGVPSFMPEAWAIRPVKIACLLRCADAIQIDQRRAPAFAFAIHCPDGPSRLHWMAQQLSQPLIKPETGEGPGALVFTSQYDFSEDKADAWWIAYDLIKNANEELQGCYQLMKDLRLPTFVVDRVAGAEGPTQLERHVRTAGWRPINAQVRVSSVQQILRLFGGPLLYGRDPSVPLRELIQNASDAVRARRRLAADDLYEGKVLVSLRRGDETNAWRLIVEDDGIGMSERVLTGPLLEFGKSFWGSEEAQDEFPGLVSARLDQGGRFGIGFFSTLMIAQRIEVTSRRWNAGHDQARKLTFREGLKLRPLVSTTVGAPLGQFSTRVELHISSADAEELLSVSRDFRHKTKISLKQLVAHLCPSLDCDVWVCEANNQAVLAHSRKWFETDSLEWVRQINFSDSRTDEPIEDYLIKEAPFIQVIEDQDGEPRGRAAIAFGVLETGIHAVGRLAAILRSIDRFSTTYVGSIGYEPAGPSRSIGALSNEAEVRAWASAQAVLLGKADINDSEKYLAAMNVADFGGDPTPVARILINRNMTSLGEVYNMLAGGKEIFVVLRRSGGPDLSIGAVGYWANPHIGIGLASNELDFASPVMEAWSGSQFPDQVYHRIFTDRNPLPSCFLACLKRYAESKGCALAIEAVTDALFGTYKGKESQREKLSVGTELRGAAIKLTLTQ